MMSVCRKSMNNTNCFTGQHLIFEKNYGGDSITLEPGCNLTFIEYHSHPENALESTHPLTKIRLKPGSQLQHFLLKEGSTLKPFQRELQVSVEKSAHYKLAHLAIQGPANKTILKIDLEDQGATTDFYSLLFPSQHSLAELLVNIQHHKPLCKSQCITRSVLSSHAKGKVFGKVTVQENAKQTNANLQSKSLLLCETAEMFVKPEFEIYHDDLLCSHGATVGHLDREALFYLKSRGIKELAAKKLLIYAFMQPILEKFTQDKSIEKYLAPFLNHLEQELEEVLAGPAL